MIFWRGKPPCMSWVAAWPADTRYLGHPCLLRGDGVCAHPAAIGRERSFCWKGREKNLSEKEMRRECVEKEKRRDFLMRWRKEFLLKRKMRFGQRWKEKRFLGKEERRLLLHTIDISRRHIGACVCVRACVPLCMHAFMCVCVCVYECQCVRAVCVRAHTRACVCACVRSYVWERKRDTERKIAFCAPAREHCLVSHACIYTYLQSSDFLAVRASLSAVLSLRECRGLRALPVTWRKYGSKTSINGVQDTVGRSWHNGADHARCARGYQRYSKELLIMRCLCFCLGIDIFSHSSHGLTAECVFQ